jgi:hypothetical protein
MLFFPRAGTGRSQGRCRPSTFLTILRVAESTDGRMQRFAAHGEFTIRSYGPVMRVDARGPWNLECTADYVLQFKTCMHDIQKPFAVLMISHEQPILGPEGEEVLRSSVRERVELGCKAQATVLLDPSSVEVARAQYARVYVPEGLNHAIFRSIAPAAEWLTEQGFAVVKRLCRDEPRPN